MNTEPNQVEGPAQDGQLSALCERLFRRHSEPIGIIDVREAERLYARIIGWIAGRYGLLEQLMSRYRMDDLSGDGQPFVLAQSFQEMINAASAPGSTLPSQAVSFPPGTQTQAYASTPIHPSAVPPTDSNTDSMQTSAARFRVSRRPPPVSNMEQSDDWQSGGSAAAQSTAAAHQPDDHQSTTSARELRESEGPKLTQSASPQPPAAPLSLTAPEASDERQPPLSLELAQASPPAETASQSPSVDAAKPASANQAPTAIVRELANHSAEAIPFSDPLLLKADSPTEQPGDSQSAPAAQTTREPIAEARPAEASQATKETPTAKRPAIAREIRPKAADAISPSEPPHLGLAQSSQTHLPAGERENADQRAAHAERKDEVSRLSSVDAARPVSVDQAATATPVESQSAEVSTSPETAPTAKRPAVARELTNHSAEAIPFSDPLSLKEDSQTQQPGEPQSTSSTQSDGAMEIKPTTRQAEPGAAMEMALTFSPTQTAQSEALFSPSRAQGWSSRASQSRSPKAAEMRREPVNSQPVDFIWREGDDAAADLARQQSGVSVPPTAPGFKSSAATSSSSPDQRAAQPPTPEQSQQVNLEKLPDHVINTISQQVIRALSRILTVERERKGIR